MKKMMSHGLMLAALLSLSVPLAAHADDMTQTTTTTTTSGVTPTVSSSTMTAPVVASQTVIMSPANYPAGYSMPKLSMLPGGNLELHLLNFSDQPLTFSSPSVNLSYVVPANSERVVYIDSAMAANLTPGQEVAYYVQDSSGNQIASSSIVSEPTIASQINTNTTVAETTTTTTTPVSTETTTTVERKSTVRGFW